MGVRVLGGGRVTGILLLVSGVVLGLAIAVWLAVSSREAAGGRSGGAVLGGVLALACLIVPLVAGGIYLLIRGQAEVKDYAAVQQERTVLNMVETRGEVRVADVALEINATRDQVQEYIYDLVGKGLFTGYVDWKGGGQVNYLREFGDDWWFRWQQTVARGFKPEDIPRYSGLGVNYIVLRKQTAAAPLFENPSFAVYGIRN